MDTLSEAQSEAKKLAEDIRVKESQLKDVAVKKNEQDLFALDKDIEVYLGFAQKILDNFALWTLAMVKADTEQATVCESAQDVDEIKQAIKCQQLSQSLENLECLSQQAMESYRTHFLELQE